MKYPVVKVASWEEYRTVVESPKFRSWGFRGHSDARWPLFSALSRHLRYAQVHTDAWAGQAERILRIFRRKAHLFWTTSLRRTIRFNGSDSCNITARQLVCST